MPPAPPSGENFLEFLSAPRVAAGFWNFADAKQLSAHKKNGLEAAEIRIDLADIKTAEEGEKLIAAYSSLPVILTIRAENEGGGWRQTEDARRELYLRLLPFAAAADVELAAEIRGDVLAAAKQLKKAVVFSRHNFSAADSFAAMDEAAARAFAEGADIFKTACMVFSENDLPPLYEFTQKWKTRPVVAVGMGESAAARLARLELPKRGSRIAFAAAGEKTAPGQLSLAETAAAVKAARLNGV